MTQNFRTAFRGFNQEDVVNYLEFMNNQYTIRVNQITSEVDYLRKKLSGSGPDADEAAAVIEQLQEANRALDSLRSEHESLKGKYEALKNKLAMMDQVEDRTEDLNAMEAVIEKLQAENSELKKRCAELSTAKPVKAETAAPVKKDEPEDIPDSPLHKDTDWEDIGLSPDPVLSHQELESDLEIYLNNLEPVDKDFDFAPSRRDEKQVNFEFAPERKTASKVEEDTHTAKKFDFSFDVEDYLPKVNKPETSPVDLDDDFENLRRVMAKARKTLSSIDFDD